VNIVASIASVLQSFPAVVALVGGPAAPRIWNGKVGAEVYPAILFDVDTADQENDLDGLSGLVFADVAVTCRGNTSAEREALAEAVRTNGTAPGTGLAGYSGAFDAWLDARVDVATPRQDGSGLVWYDRVLHFTVSWSEPV
jgi:hypothetical protein